MNTVTAPLDLPRLVMRSALVVAVGFLLLALVLGLLAARTDTQDEIEGALALARMSQRLRALPADDARALASLRDGGRLRHVQMRITDDDGRILFDTETTPPSAALRWLMRVTLRTEHPAAPQGVAWPVARAEGRSWTVTLTASPESEQREALTNLLGLFALLTACCVLMLAVMKWNVRRAFRPLQGLLGAIARIERQDLSGVKTLPTMPIRELEATSLALKKLAASLEQAEEGRRMLAQKILTLQEDERQRLARDLHDEFGQRLTALRADAAWLRKRFATDPDTEPVVTGMGEQIAHIQRDVRDLLARLQPLGGAGAAAGDDDRPESAAHLEQLLQALAASWTRGKTSGLRCEARVVSRGNADGAVPAGDLPVPRTLVLALYRISQEAFTNAARHGGATRASVTVDIDRGGGEHGDGCTLHWTARDDGSGLALPESAFQRGNGLAGMKERVWALGGEFEWTPTNSPPWPGLELRATLACRAVSPAMMRRHAQADTAPAPLPAAHDTETSR